MSEHLGSITRWYYSCYSKIKQHPIPYSRYKMFAAYSKEEENKVHIFFSHSATISSRFCRVAVA
jgi:hypothetical protein